jgi:hypothetical protein
LSDPVINGASTPHPVFLVPLSLYFGPFATSHSRLTSADVLMTLISVLDERREGKSGTSRFACLFPQSQYFSLEQSNKKKRGYSTKRTFSRPVVINGEEEAELAFPLTHDASSSCFLLRSSDSCIRTGTQLLVP